MQSKHWSSDSYWINALNEFFRRNESAKFNVNIDMKKLQDIIYSGDSPAYKLMDGMCSVKEHEGYDGYKGAPRLVLGLLTQLDNISIFAEPNYRTEIPKPVSQTPDSSPAARRSVRLLHMVAELHKVGYQRIRIASGLAPSGCHWRCNITTIDNIKPNGWEPIDWDKGVAFYTSGQQDNYFKWPDAKGKNARQLAQLFIERFPEIARLGIGFDYEYVGWFQTMLGEAENGCLPCFFADYNIDEATINYPPSI